MPITEKIFARLGQEAITQYTLQNPGGLTLRFLSFGARIQQVRYANRWGDDPNLILGFVTVEDYLHQPGFFGAALGPRLSEDGFRARGAWQNWNWAAETWQDQALHLRLRLTLPDGADGAPGQRQLSLTHDLFPDDRWRITWMITTDTDCWLHPRLNLPFILTADPAKTITSNVLTVADTIQPIPHTAYTTPSAPITLGDDHWALKWHTPAPFVQLDPFDQIDATNNFNGILGQPRVAIGLFPEQNTTHTPFLLPAGQTKTIQQTVQITSLP